MKTSEAPLEPWQVIGALFFIFVFFLGVFFGLHWVDVCSIGAALVASGISGIINRRMSSGRRGRREREIYEGSDAVIMGCTLVVAGGVILIWGLSMIGSVSSS